MKTPPIWNPVRYLVCIIILAQACLVQANEPITDLRILIDVSGSMKQNDPQNLRAPALRLLVGLVAEGTRAGVWTFGRYVNMTVKLAQVDSQWKESARQAAGQIHSRGLFTNIESALTRATYGWDKPDARYHRHMILLTDGMVDISKSEADNAASRKKILEVILPKIKKANATVHTVALSENADHELLKAISMSTDGWYERVVSADNLQRVFLRLFEKSASVDALPMKQNRFSVDKTITDMTVLAFRAAQGKSTRIITPSGKEWDQNKHPESVKWYHEEGYDLITIKGPMQGDWQLDAAMDDDNRVMVVTNLRLKVNELPNNILLGDHLSVHAWLAQQTKRITKKSFIDLVKFEHEQQRESEPSKLILMKDDGQGVDTKEGDGIFSSLVSNIDRGGIYKITIVAKGATFQRERQHLVKIYDSPLEVEITQTEDQQPFEMRISPVPGMLQTDTIEMKFKINNKTHIVPQISREVWGLEIPVEQAGQVGTVFLQALRLEGESLNIQLDQILPGKREELEQKSDEGQAVRDVAVDANIDHRVNWIDILIAVSVVNVILLVCVLSFYLLLRVMRKKAVAKQLSEIEL